MIREKIFMSRGKENMNISRKQRSILNGGINVLFSAGLSMNNKSCKAARLESGMKIKKI